MSRQRVKLMVCLQAPGLFSDGFLAHQSVDLSHVLNSFIHRLWDWKARSV